MVLPVCFLRDFAAKNTPGPCLKYPASCFALLLNCGSITPARRNAEAMLLGCKHIQNGILSYPEPSSLIDIEHPSPSIKERPSLIDIEHPSPSIKERPSLIRHSGLEPESSFKKTAIVADYPSQLYSPPQRCKRGRCPELSQAADASPASLLS
jgi:hypothetical protein